MESTKSSKKEIIIVTETMGVDGPERVISELSKQWVKEGHHVTVVVTRSGKRAASYSFPNEIEVLFVDAYNQGGKLARIKEALGVRNILKNRPNAVCLSLMVSTSFSLAVGSIGLPNRVVLSERNDPHQVPFTEFQRKMRDLSLELADDCIFQTEDAKQYFSKRIQKKGTVIFNPVNQDLPKQYCGVRRKKIVAAGRLSGQKNFPMLIEAFSILHKELPDYTLTIFGEGEDREKLEKQIWELDLQNSVFLPGFESDVYPKLVDSACYVSSSNYEGMSNSMLEALAMGIPTVCTDCPIGGARTVIKDGENGLLVPVGDAEKMYQAIKRVISDQKFAKMMSDNAYALREKLSIEKISGQWMEIL